LAVCADAVVRMENIIGGCERHPTGRTCLLDFDNALDFEDLDFRADFGGLKR
jgi:hypothetical protein